jgi:hypothetical protein
MMTANDVPAKESPTEIATAMEKWNQSTRRVTTQTMGNG